MSLLPVKRLTITILVDNCIEWMTKFPPGFSSELKQHLTQDPPIDELTGVPIVDLEHYCCGAHGFSALIDTSSDGDTSYKTLFDAGPDSKSLVRNIESLKIPVSEIKTIILSHWHADHSGGILSFLKLPGVENVEVDLHPSRPVARGIAVPPTYETVIGRLPADPPFKSIELAGGIVRKHSDGHSVAGRTVWMSGSVPRVTKFEQGLLGGVRWVVSKWQSEPHIMDERYAVVDVAGKGLVLFSACSHAGIVNVVKDAVNQFSRPIYMIVGGLHLAGPELAARIPLTVDFLANEVKPPPVYILPMHCSGFNAKVALKEAFGEGCVPAGVGMKIDIIGS